ncbi:MAG TPA: M67 family metallopeptidase [Pyrinomonadaceae bacterium]|jgi:proteasome lid subunit RPN8/RPN11|nr:M67 family metallopeptidase [Pyrinomonadaceae bacterium]
MLAKLVAQASQMTTLTLSQLNEIFAYARAADPAECCGLIGGADDGTARTIYPMRNLAADKIVSYEAAPKDLLAAQRLMRERGEELLAIYHSHPLATEPTPSERDVRQAYHPKAVYLIVGLAGPEPVMRAFQIWKRERRWQRVEYVITDE